MAVVYYFASQRGAVPPLIWLTLLIAIYLTVLELRHQPMQFRVKAWWVSLVFVTHFFGYLALRAWLFYDHRHGAQG